MSEGKKADYFIDFTKPSPRPWTTPGPLDDNRPQKITINPSEVTANPNNQEGVTTVKGIDKRVGKDGAISY
ncbi:MAG: hypothetical protein NTZ52_05325, partial [Chlamydiae bacterium]|nr:hypothetical protein [Chlamydiota bacterium]